MRRIAIVAALCLASGAPAFAMTLEEMLREAVANFQATDKNGDGVIDRHELDESIRAQFKKLDVNGDGVIDYKDNAHSHGVPQSVDLPAGTSPQSVPGGRIDLAPWPRVNGNPEGAADDAGGDAPAEIPDVIPGQDNAKDKK